MAADIKTETIEPRDLSTGERERLIDELFAVQEAVFDGVDRKSFVKYVVDSPAEATWIDVFRAGGGEAVGYMALHRFDKRFGDKPCIVFRAEAGVLRKFRGQAPVGDLIKRKVLPAIVANPGRSIYYLGSLVHPSSYHAFSRFASRIYPNGSEPTPPDIHQFMCQLGDEFGLAVVNPERPLVRDVGWRTRDTDVERDYWRHCPKPTVQFFLEANPGYVDGDGLITLIPFTAADAAVSFWNNAVGRTRRSLVKMRSSMQKIPGLRPSMSRESIAESLAQVALFEGLSADVLEAIIDGCETRIAAPGEWIFREGDRGDRAYMLVSGAAYVVAERDDEEVVLDELHEGEIFGEMALITGATRSASVRSATASRLLTMKRKQLLALLDRSADLAAAAWSAFDLRSFNSAVKDLGRFDGVEHLAREDWFRSGMQSTVEAGESASAEAPGVLFVAAGAIELVDGARRLLTGAPVLVEHDGELRVSAARKSRLVWLPPPPASSARRT